MKKIKLSSLFLLNNENVEVLQPEQMKQLCGGDGVGGDTTGGNDATGGPPDANTANSIPVKKS